MRSLNWISAKSLMSAQHECEIWLRSNEGIIINHDPPTHWDLFLSFDVFYEYISIKIAYFHLNTINYFFIVKIVDAFI